jgi:Flp pilus assembly protein TadB
MNPRLFSLALIALALFSYFHSFLLAFVDIISLFAVALAMALARVATLEAELKTTTEALKDANSAKVSADKAAKAAKTKAKKAEKGLAEATQKQAKREQAVVERLDEIFTSVGSKCFVLSLCLARVTSIDILFLAYFSFCDVAEKLGEVWKLRQESAKDPLLDTVEVLKSNSRLAGDVLQ